MGWVEEQIPDFILMTLYLYTMLRVITSSDPYFRTTFFILFLSTGTCRILTVVTHILEAKIPYPESMVVLFNIIWILNLVGAFGSTLGKFFITFHRYDVFRSVDIVENKWTGLFLKGLLLTQFVLPLAFSVPVIFAKLVTNVNIIQNLDNEAIVINKLINTLFYFAYIILSLIITILTWFKLVKFASLVDDRMKKDILGQQRRMFLIVILCTLGHLVKALHQFVWALTTYMNLVELANKIWPFYPYANGLATYTAPITLILFSPKVRHLLIFRNTPQHSSTPKSVVLKTGLPSDSDF